MSQSAFQPGSQDLRAALVDLVRVGASGNAAGVRQLAQRLIKRVPRGIGDEAEFREALAGALAAGLSKAPGRSFLLRSALAEELPVDSDSRMAVALLESCEGAPAPILSIEARSRLESVLEERRGHEKLVGLGLRPTGTVLLTGPPGVGKTMCARYFAGALEVPLLTVDLASIVSSYLGKTGQNLRAALEFGRTRECLLFLDEFDALAKRRDDDTDIGELKRIVNVLLLELERWPATSLLVAATNHPQLLDSAVGRRFDSIIEIGLPGLSERQAMARRLLERADLTDPSETSEIVAACTKDCSGSDIQRLVDTALRRSALQNSPILDNILQVLLERHSMPERGDFRDKLCVLAADRLGWSSRKIGLALGISHPTVGKILHRLREVEADAG